jgi:hypothetical protein
MTSKSVMSFPFQSRTAAADLAREALRDDPVSLLVSHGMRVVHHGRSRIRIIPVGDTTARS